MAYEKKEGEGTLFRNDRKEPGSKHPDYTGSIFIGGKDKRLAGWVRKSQSGKTFLSVQVSEYEERPPQPGAPAPAPQRPQAPAAPVAPAPAPAPMNEGKEEEDLPF